MNHAKQTQPSEAPQHVGLDEEHDIAAYHCGRLLAVCQHIQNLVAPEVNASYVGRFYSGASMSPVAVLPRVYRSAQHRLRAVRPAWVHAEIESLLCRIHEHIGREFPRQLSLAEQGHFQLGYFHQQSQLPQADSTTRYQTRSGSAVKSLGERTVADTLNALGIQFVYEESAAIPGDLQGKKLSPDFTIRGADDTTLFIEYLGMIGDEGYDKKWNWKRACYHKDFQAKTVKEVEIEGQPGRFNLMLLEPKDIRSVAALKKSLLDALNTVFGPSFPTDRGQS